MLHLCSAVSDHRADQKTSDHFIMLSCQTMRRFSRSPFIPTPSSPAIHVCGSYAYCRICDADSGFSCSNRADHGNSWEWWLRKMLAGAESFETSRVQLGFSLSWGWWRCCLFSKSFHMWVCVNELQGWSWCPESTLGLSWPVLYLSAHQTRSLLPFFLTRRLLRARSAANTPVRPTRPSSPIPFVVTSKADHISATLIFSFCVLFLRLQIHSRIWFSKMFGSVPWSKLLSALFEHVRPLMLLRAASASRFQVFSDGNEFSLRIWKVGFVP